ncbi:DUF4920 domain-containing protein [Mucilaginibacter paludis]|uniref:DUF4920 domain-containing protein n=1 Tax=Mucilaginibacter paludis DSM 18603 TaxID=714943 RepID=H1Y023_9SPHI|nr:DUF4920 domain-containing protein [Mucilaginibacter paludis]EHQ27932.1 hypothetical protein, secreted [Mucilaginibacter paludis DSM 18603]
MKIACIITTLMMPVILLAQKHTPLPHGMTFGQQVNSRQNIPAANVEAFMGKKTRISTTLTGKVLKVDHPKGGWFRMDAGNGKIIRVHFKDYNITIPTALKGRTVMIEGVAQKEFIADDMQHFAGDTVKGKKQHQVKTNPRQRLTFEATGLMVEE